MYRVRTAITGGPGGAELNTMYFDNSLTLTAQDAADAVRAFWDSIKGVIKAGYTMQVESNVVHVADFTGVPTGISTVTTAPVGGTNGLEALPGATQGLLRLHTGVYYGGRELQGRIFIPGPTEDNNDVGGVPKSTYRATLDAALATLIADPDSNLFVWSRKNLNANGVTGGSAWTQWAVLRSRRQ